LGCALPLFDIPLIVRIIKRKSSEDISLWWIIGLWVCFVILIPSWMKSTDIVWKSFNVVNLVLLTAVLIVTVKYHKPMPKKVAT
jgi:hypothetical protein